MVREDLRKYADMKGLTVNATKSEVVVFGSRGVSGEAGRELRRAGSAGFVSFLYGQARLAVKGEFKYLGMVFGSTLNMARMQQSRARG